MEKHQLKSQVCLAAGYATERNAMAPPSVMRMYLRPTHKSPAWSTPHRRMTDCGQQEVKFIDCTCDKKLKIAFSLGFSIQIQRAIRYVAVHLVDSCAINISCFASVVREKNTHGAPLSPSSPGTDIVL